MTTLLAIQWRRGLGLLTLLGVIATLAAVGLATASGNAEGDPQEDRPLDNREVLMRRKLDHAQRILGGLAEGRFDPIARSARALEEISEVAALYNLPTADYRRFSNEFRHLTRSLAEKAEARDLDGTTLLNVQLTINCVDCHKYVRIQTNEPRPPR